MVAYEYGASPVVRQILTAGGAITTADVGKALVFSSGKVILNTTAGGRVIGLVGNVQSTLADGDSVEVVMLGECIAQGGATFARGVNLTSNASGQLITAASTNQVVGIALEAGTSGGYSRVLFNQQGVL
jgi:hypothetical protein